MNKSGATNEFGCRDSLIDPRNLVNQEAAILIAVERLCGHVMSTHVLALPRAYEAVLAEALRAADIQPRFEEGPAICKAGSLPPLYTGHRCCRTAGQANDSFVPDTVSSVLGGDRWHRCKAAG